jgi:DNA-directed RNA polymerase specialized sigma24 family protein
MNIDLLEIYDAYYHRVTLFITGLVKDEWIAEDLIQETFIRVQKNYDSVRDLSKLSSWIFHRGTPRSGFIEPENASN